MNHKIREAMYSLGKMAFGALAGTGTAATGLLVLLTVVSGIFCLLYAVGYTAVMLGLSSYAGSSTLDVVGIGAAALICLFLLLGLIGFLYAIAYETGKGTLLLLKEWKK